MKRLLLAFVVATVAGAAGAQTVPRAPATPSQTSAAGSAGVKARMEALGYKDVHDLRRGPDGQWRGQATRNNIGVSVTADPSGNVIAR